MKPNVKAQEAIHARVARFRRKKKKGKKNA